MRVLKQVLCCLLLTGCCLAYGEASRVSDHMRQESTLPVTTTSPPEGNTTFVSGATWCVALPGVALNDLQLALDWACGEGSADCSHVQPGRDCFLPDTILSHASYAFNSYYQQNGNSDIACNFGGIAAITKRNPSYGSCKYPTSEPSFASPMIRSVYWRWELGAILLLLLYF